MSQPSDPRPDRLRWWLFGLLASLVVLLAAENLTRTARLDRRWETLLEEVGPFPEEPWPSWRELQIAGQVAMGAGLREMEKERAASDPEGRLVLGEQELGPELTEAVERALAGVEQQFAGEWRLPTEDGIARSFEVLELAVRSDRLGPEDVERLLLLARRMIGEGGNNGAFAGISLAERLFERLELEPNLALGAVGIEPPEASDLAKSFVRGQLFELSTDPQSGTFASWSRSFRELSFERTCLRLAILEMHESIEPVRGAPDRFAEIPGRSQGSRWKLELFGLLKVPSADFLPSNDHFGDQIAPLGLRYAALLESWRDVSGSPETKR